MGCVLNTRIPRMILSRNIRCVCKNWGVRVTTLEQMEIRKNVFLEKIIFTNVNM